MTRWRKILGRQASGIASLLRQNDVTTNIGIPLVTPLLGIPMLKIRRSCDRLNFNMRIPIPGKDGLYIETVLSFARCSNISQMLLLYKTWGTLHWRHNGRHGVSNHQPHHCLLNRLFGRRSKTISKLRVTGLCAGNPPGTGEFPAQMASKAENVSIWWRHHDLTLRNHWIIEL